MDGLPLYAKVRNSIKDGIEKGLIRPDDEGRLPGQQHFADIYGVGIMTVKRAIRDLEEMGLVESRRGKGLVLKSGSPRYEKNIAGIPKINHIGVAFFDAFKNIGSPMVMQLLSGVEKFASENLIALHVMSFPGIEIDIQENTLFSNVSFMNLDGLLLLSPVTSSSIAKIMERKMPYVSLNLISDEYAICHMPDATTSVYKVVDILLNKGCRNIVGYIGNENKISAHLRYSGFKHAFYKHGLDLDDDMISYLDYDISEIRQHIKGLIESGKKIDAVVAVDDVVAAGCDDYLRSMGLNDVLIAGYGNVDMFKDKIDVTVEAFYDEIGYNLIKMLIEIINGKYPRKKKYYYATEIIDRININTH